MGSHSRGFLNSRSSRNIRSSRRNLRINSSRSISSSLLNLPRNPATVSRSNRNNPVTVSSPARSLVMVSRRQQQGYGQIRNSSSKVTVNSRNKVNGQQQQGYPQQGYGQQQAASGDQFGQALQVISGIGARRRR